MSNSPIPPSPGAPMPQDPSMTMPPNPGMPMPPNYGYLAQQPPVAPQKNVLGIVALVLAVLGTVLSLIPGIIILGWILLPVSFVLGLVALFLRNKTRGFAIVAVVTSVVGTIIAVIGFLLIIANALDQAIKDEQQVTVSTETGTENKENSASGEKEATSETKADSTAGTTRENPVPLGATITSKDWEIVVNSVNLDATQVLLEHSKFNDPPEAGEHYVLVNLTAKYIGNKADGATPWTTVKYVTKEGKTFDVLAKYIDVPERFDQLSELYNGASTTGNIALAVKTDDIKGGVLKITPDLLADDVFMKVK
ncbi:MAG: DUF4190 domain-containing protein [Actinomycetaceae bacterium]|nr:DUF4190 domain-containing protein [Actinomycetaceae bacterium]